jgi:hypothetical protein
VNEKQILSTITQIARNATSFSNAVEEVSALLQRGVDGRVILVLMPDKRSGGGQSVARHAEHFFDETTGLPYRSLYTVALSAHGRELGKLVAFFASGCSHDGVAQRLAQFAGEELGVLLERIRLAGPVRAAQLEAVR